MKEPFSVPTEKPARDHQSLAERYIDPSESGNFTGHNASAAMRGTACPDCRTPMALRRTGGVRVHNENWEIEVRCRNCGHMDWHIGV